MTVVIFYFFFLLVMFFGLVVFFGAPYLPTLSRTKEIALDLLDMKQGQTLLELGSGDGKVMLAAAERGLKVVGYELNPILVVISLYRTRAYRQQVKVIWGNFFTKKWPPYDAIFVFLTDKYMSKLDKKIRENHPKILFVASNSFKIPGKKPVKESRGVYLYRY